MPFFNDFSQSVTCLLILVWLINHLLRHYFPDFFDDRPRNKHRK